MNWFFLRAMPWIDTRASFVASVRRAGNLLDLGSSDGGTLQHYAELRRDLAFSSSDLAGSPEVYPGDTDFRRADFECDRLPWADATFDAVTCMHVVEHLNNPAHVISEATRVLKHGGQIYLETPHPKSLKMQSPQGEGTEHITVNFFDDGTHVKPVPLKELLEGNHSLSIVRSGVSRNLLIAAAYPVLLAFRKRTRARYVAQLHWTGWSTFAIATRL